MVGRLVFVLVWLCLPSVASAFTAFPVPYSGTLSESGAPVTGTRHVEIRVYETAVGGSPRHAQAESLAVVAGVYHTQIVAAPDVWDGSDRWVGVSINGGSELSPRVQVGWVPYAVRTAQTPTLVTRPSTSVSVPDQWTRVDSLTFTAPSAGVTILNSTGFAVWTGAITATSVQLAIDETTPATPLTVVRATSGSDGMSMTYMVATSAGPHTYYVWARTLGAGQTYQVNSQRFQAIFFPN